MKHKRYSTVLLACTITAVLLAGNFFFLPHENEIEADGHSPEAAYENFLVSRSYPYQTFDTKAFYQVANQIQAQNQTKSNTYLWTLQGPQNIGGRFNCVVTDPTDTSIIYAGAAQGGLFKTTNGGVSWLPIFDAQPFLSIGHIKIDPTNHNKIWVGTGDVNISGNVYTGDGVYMSYNGGSTWQQKGLANTKVVAQVEVDPTDSNTIYAAAMGNPFAKDNNRGLYKSIDGGSTWVQSLFINDSCGVMSMVIDPNNHNILYAASFNRMRDYNRSVVGGNETRIWKSINGGTSWTVQTNGLPTGNISRINLCAHANGGNTMVYACMIDYYSYDVMGIFRTNNGGTTWSSMQMNNLNPTAMNGQGWYYGNIMVDPLNANHIFTCGLELMESFDGGDNWNQLSPSWWTYDVHADKHWLSFDMFNNLLIATDGGLYKSNDAGITWRDIENTPVSQFYHVAFDPNNTAPNPDYYGGLQDNGTTGGNASSINNWSRIYGGDGFQPGFEKGDPSIMYAEVQYGSLNVSTSGGAGFTNLTAGLNLADSLKPWDMKYIISPHNQTRLYCGTDQVYVLNNSPVGTWSPISPTLTKPFFSGKKNNVVSCLAESPKLAGTLLVGTGDGNLWRCVNQSNWLNITGTLPNRYFTSVNFSFQSHKRYFVTAQGYRFNDNTPHIYRSDDSAATWQSVQGDMPNVGLNDLYVIKQNDSFMIAATDAGLFATENAGNHWKNISGNIPMCPVLDVELDTIRNILLAGTYARGMYTIPLDSVFASIRNLFLPADTTADTTGVGMQSTSNQAYSICPNPFHTNFSIKSSNRIKHITIYNNMGRMVLSKNVTVSEIITLPESCTSGIYLAEITDASEHKQVIKILKE